MKNSDVSFPQVSFDAWKTQVEKELKGAAFNDVLVKQKEGISVQPLYTDRVERVLNEDADEDEIWEEQAGTMRWNSCETYHYNSNDNAFDRIAKAYNDQIACLEVFGDIKSFLKSLEGTLPVPVSLLLRADSFPANDDEVQEWRTCILGVKAYHPFIRSLTFDPLSSMLISGKDELTEQVAESISNLQIKLIPHLNDSHLIGVDSSCVGEGGGSSALQLAYALSAANTYISQLRRGGLELFEIAHLFSFKFSIQTDFYLEIAKLKAFSVLWRNLLEAWDESFDYFEDPNIFAVTSRVQFAQGDKHNNLLRATTSAMSAVLGGADTICIAPYQTPSDEHSNRMAQNIHHLLRYESYLDLHASAAEGTYFIEHLISELATEAWKLFKELEGQGGSLKSIRTGFIQKKVAEMKNDVLEQYRNEKRILVGVNKYAMNQEIKFDNSIGNEGEFPAIPPFNIEQALKQN